MAHHGSHLGRQASLAMLPDLSALSLLLEAAVVGFSVLGGMMAAASGYAAWRAVEAGRALDRLTPEINRGIVIGFEIGVYAALVAAIIVLGAR